MLMFSLQLLLKGDDFYSIRLPSSVANPPGRDYVISSVKAASIKHPLLKKDLDYVVFFALVV